MKFLADMGVAMTTVLALRNCGEDVVHLRELDLHTLADDLILSKAAAEQRVVLTFDLDFGELLAIAGTSKPSVILFRLRDQTPASVTPRLLQVIDSFREGLEAGAIVLVEEAGFRVRRLPIRRL